RQRDAHVHAADARAPLVVLLAPRAGEQRVHPRLERHLEAADLALAALERLARLGVIEDALVENRGDALELGRGLGGQRAQRGLVGGAPLHVALQLFEQRLHRRGELITRATRRRAPARTRAGSGRSRRR